MPTGNVTIYFETLLPENHIYDSKLNLWQIKMLAYERYEYYVTKIGNYYRDTGIRVIQKGYVFLFTIEVRHLKTYRTRI